MDLVHDAPVSEIPTAQPTRRIADNVRMGAELIWALITREQPKTDVQTFVFRDVPQSELNTQLRQVEVKMLVWFLPQPLRCTTPQTKTVWI